MIILPPYLYDYQVHARLDPADQWIYDKLELATRLGHSCGASAVVPPPGEYCVRPQENLFGMGKGGFFKVHTDNWMQEPGYFWCEWFNGPHHWVQYIEDSAVHYSTYNMNGEFLEGVVTPTPQAPALDPVLQNLSRYLLVEMVGDKIIEAAPRFMPRNAQERFIANWRVFNSEPQYDPLNDGVEILFGITDMKREPITIGGHDGYTWGDSDLVDYNRRSH